MTRRVRVALVLVALLVVGGFAILIMPRGPRLGDGITFEAIAAVQRGMTYAEVEAIMGCPHGKYGSYTKSMVIADLAYITVDKDGKNVGYREEYWVGRHACMSVKFYKRSGIDDVVFDVKIIRMIEGRFSLANSLREACSRVLPW